MDNGVPPADKDSASGPARPRGSTDPKPRNGSAKANASVPGARGGQARASSAANKGAPRRSRQSAAAGRSRVVPAPPATVAADEPEVNVLSTPSRPLSLTVAAPEGPDVLAPAADDAVDTEAVPHAVARVLLPPIVPGELDPVVTPAVPGIEPSPSIEQVDTVTQPAVEPAPEAGETDGTDGLPALTRPKKPMRPLRKPTMVSRRRPRVRRVTRVVRHVDTWSVFKVALVFNLFLYAVCLTAGVLLWQVAQNTGTVDNIERFFENFGWETFQLNGGKIYHGAWIAGLFVVVGLIGLAVLLATLFNLITDLVGGIRVSVLEEEVVAREERGMGWRRFPRRQAPTTSEPPPVD